MQWNDIKEVFEEVGEITRVDIPKEKNKNKGFSFIEYKNEKSV